MEFVLVANPENRRAAFFRDAVERRGGQCRVVAWADVLDGAPVHGEAIRIESPGENWTVESALLGRDEPEDLGRIRGLEQVYVRFVELLESFPSDARYMNPPAAIAAMFDKVESKRRLRRAGLQVPPTYGLVRSFDELREVTREHGRGRYFVKPRHGSSASGVIALTIRADRVLAVTSVELDDAHLYNSLKLRRYETFDELEKIVDLLGLEDELIVEDWIPKASSQSANYDLRLVPIGGIAEHAVMRCSRSPMTNLHLGNRRGDLGALRESLGPRWEEITASARRALGAFEGALYAGVDVALTTDLRRIVTFEVNAFGDLLPGIEDARGRDTYEAELDAFMGTRT